MAMKRLLMANANAMAFAFAFAMTIAFVFANPADAVAEETERIADGVYIGSIDAGGMTQEEAQSAIDAYVESAGMAEITLSAGESGIAVPASEFGITFSNKNIIAEAMDVGKSGNLIKRYKDKKDLENGSKVIPMQLEVDESAVESVLKEHVDELDKKAVNCGLTRTNGAFQITEGEQGIEVDVEESVAAIRDYVSQVWDGTNASITLAAEVVEPRGTKEELSRIKDVLGSYGTSYETSGANRCTNIAVAASKIDGTVLYPGEEFSVYETIGPLDGENGYELAGSYENGQTVESYGGGVCQVSTTLYNAVIRAELEITQRSNHSMIVSYVDPSMDAAIAGDYKDLKFVNNLEVPVYIEGYTQGKSLHFTVYGEETRPSNREVSFVSEVISQQDPGTQFVGTGDPIGYIGVSQSKHIGYVAQLWKVVTVGGVEQSREVFNKSTYNASPKIVRVGTASENPEASAAVSAALATGDEASIYATVGQFTMASSAAPEEEEEPQMSQEEQAITGTVDESQITNEQEE